jgi:hypothetical protein
VSGDDPYFLWRLETPIQAFGIHVDVDVDDEGTLQLFWSTPRCPIFSEPCSATIPVHLGRQMMDFLLDSHDPLRELRLDLPEHVGTRMNFRAITILRSPELGPSWVPNASIAAVNPGQGGLYIDANAPDPWLTTLVPGMDATRITAAELVLRGPADTAPQLYFAEVPGGFQEPSSVHFTIADAGELTHRAKLRGASGWTGRLRTLRFDPGPNAGRYVIERFALVHDPSD